MLKLIKPSIVSLLITIFTLSCISFFINIFTINIGGPTYARAPFPYYKISCGTGFPNSIICDNGLIMDGVILNIFTWILTLMVISGILNYKKIKFIGKKLIKLILVIFVLGGIPIAITFLSLVISLTTPSGYTRSECIKLNEEILERGHYDFYIGPEFCNQNYIKICREKYGIDIANCSKIMESVTNTQS